MLLLASYVSGGSVPRVFFSPRHHPLGFSLHSGFIAALVSLLASTSSTRFLASSLVMMKPLRLLIYSLESTHSSFDLLATLHVTECYALIRKCGYRSSCVSSFPMSRCIDPKHETGGGLLSKERGKPLIPFLHKHYDKFLIAVIPASFPQAYFSVLPVKRGRHIVCLL